MKIDSLPLSGKRLIGHRVGPSFFRGALMFPRDRSNLKASNPEFYALYAGLLLAYTIPLAVTREQLG